MPDPEPGKAQSVPVVEADVLDDMNETDSLIAQRAYEIYQSRGGAHGSDQEDWFSAEREVLSNLGVDYEVSDNGVRLTAQVLGFAAKDLEVLIGHRRAVIYGIHPGSTRRVRGLRQEQIIGIAELPFAVHPASARATLQTGTLHVLLPRLVAR